MAKHTNSFIVLVCTLSTRDEGNRQMLPGQVSTTNTVTLVHIRQ